MDRAAAIKVPLLDLRAQYASVKDEVDEAVAHVLERGNYVMGREVEAFEAEWAQYCSAKYCIGVSSGTDAIHLAIRGFQKMTEQPKPSVTAPCATFIATVEPAIRAGCALKLADVDVHGLLRSPAGPGRGQIVLPVALYGRPVGWVEGEYYHGYAVIEDLAQAHGHPLRGLAAAFSFYPSKNLGAVGQAGAVVTNNTSLMEEVRRLRSHGEGRLRFVHVDLSGNYRMDELQAAILRAKLPHLDAWNRHRRKVASEYCRLLADVPGITLPELVPAHVHHIFCIRTPRRDDLAAFLAERGVQTAVRYPLALHQQPALSFLKSKAGDFPNAEAWAWENLSLPIYETMPQEQVEYVASAVREWAKRQP